MVLKEVVGTTPESSKFTLRGNDDEVGEVWMRGPWTLFLWDDVPLTQESDEADDVEDESEVDSKFASSDCERDNPTAEDAGIEMLSLVLLLLLWLSILIDTPAAIFNGLVPLPVPVAVP